MKILIILFISILCLGNVFGCMVFVNKRLKNNIVNFIKDFIMTCLIFLDFGIIIGTIERMV